MEVNENWEIWKPINNLSNKYELDFISDEIGKNLKIILVDENNKSNKVQVIFKTEIACYRKTFSNFRENTYYKLYEKHSRDFYLKWTFFEIQNSKYLKWLSEESGYNIDNLKLIHFCILTFDIVIDLIADYEPSVEFIKD